jgi:hypothetical protein
MTLLKGLLPVLLLIGLPLPSFALEVPEIVTKGLEAYQETRYEEAFQIWLKNSPLENDKTSYTNIKGSFTQIEAGYGRMVGYEIFM